MLLSDLVQRLVIGPWLWLRPQSRHSVLGHWLQFLAWWVTRPLEVIGGASLRRPLRVVPCEPGTLIVLKNQDVPGVIGRVGTILGDHSINIAGYHQARRSKGGDALAAIAVDGEVGGAVREALLELDEVSSAVVVGLG